MIEQAVLEAVKQVKKWTRRELATMLAEYRQGKTAPLIIPLGEYVFLIGNYAILHDDQIWRMIYRYNDDTIEFLNRNAAIFYAICMQTNRSYLANTIKKYDEEINRLVIEEERLKQRISQANRKKNHYNYDLYTNKYQNVRARLVHHRSLLEKNLKHAKYSNH
jgi:hypothetical protein